MILDLISHSEWEEAMSEARERADVEGRKELERMERARLRRLELDEEINEQVPPIEETSIDFRCPFRTLPCAFPLVTPDLACTEYTLLLTKRWRDRQMTAKLTKDD